MGRDAGGAGDPRCVGEEDASLMTSDEVNRSPGEGDELDVTIDSVAFGGDGVARVGGYVIFVPDVIPGERVRIAVTASKRSYGRGVVVRILEASADRVDPRCPVYGTCGGCQYQHVSYARSLDLKARQLREVASRIGGLAIDEVCDAVSPAPAAYGYRSAVSLRVRKTGHILEAGYSARDNTTFVPISRCPIASAQINDVLARVDSILSRHEHPDSIDRVSVKSAGGETLVYPHHRGPFRSPQYEVLVYRLGRLIFHFGATTFFQVNHDMIPVLLDVVAEGLSPDIGETLFDLYAGVGLFSIGFAERYGHVFGIESGSEAVTCFQENIRANSLTNVTAIRGRVETKIAGALSEMEGKRVSVVVDPPRTGMTDDVVRFLMDAPIDKLVYVSCDPATLARDLKPLVACYTLRKMTPLDLFPQTKHLETVAVLERPTS